MTQQQILLLLNIKGITSKDINLKDLLNFYKLLVEVKKDIVSSEVLQYDIEVSGYRGNANWLENSIKVTTTFGYYVFPLPNNCDFYRLICDLDSRFDK